MSSFTNWVSGEPNNAGYGANGYNYENCVAKYHGANTMFDQGCTATYAFICKEMREAPAAHAHMVAEVAGAGAGAGDVRSMGTAACHGTWALGAELPEAWPPC